MRRTATDSHPQVTQRSSRGKASLPYVVNQPTRRASPYPLKAGRGIQQSISRLRKMRCCAVIEVRTWISAVAYIPCPSFTHVQIISWPQGGVLGAVQCQCDPLIDTTRAPGRSSHRGNGETEAREGSDRGLRCVNGPLPSCWTWLWLYAMSSSSRHVLVLLVCVWLESERERRREGRSGRTLSSAARCRTTEAGVCPLSCLPGLSLPLRETLVVECMREEREAKQRGSRPSQERYSKIERRRDSCHDSSPKYRDSPI